MGFKNVCIIVNENEVHKVIKVIIQYIDHNRLYLFLSKIKYKILPIGIWL